VTLNGCKTNVETTLNLACILGEDILSLFKMAHIDKRLVGRAQQRATFYTVYFHVWQ